MPLMVWAEDLDTGISVIDDDHKKLLGMLNQLHEGATSGGDPASIGKILDGLVLYTAFHFRREEKLFSDTQYAGEVAHKKEHVEFTNKILDAQKKYKSGAEQISNELIEFLKGWLITHIKVVDKRYVPHLLSKGIS